MTDPGGTNPAGAGPMTGPAYPGSPYESETSYQLSNIDFSKFPVTNDNMVDNVTRLNQFADYISQYMLTMQEGIDQGQENVLQKVQGFATNLVQLFGNGSLLFGIDLGDLQYYLPAIGALLGFNQTDPFPINLFDAAEQFFLGYVVPLDSFASTINTIIDEWATALGLDADWTQTVNDLVTAYGNVAVSIEDFVNDVVNLLGIFGVTSGEFGPFSELWNAISTLLGGNPLGVLSTIVNPVFHALAPWIEDLAILVNDVSEIINAFAGGLSNVQAIANFASMFTSVLDLLPGASTNLLTNPTVATDADWDITPMSDTLPGGAVSNANFNPTVSTTVGDPAPGSIQFEGTGNSWTTSQLVAVNANDVCTAYANYIFANVGESGATVTVQIYEYTDDEQLEGDYTLLRAISGTTIDISGTDATWTEISIASPYTVSTDATNIALNFVVFLPNGGSVNVTKFNLTDTNTGTFDIFSAWTDIFTDFLGPLGTLLGNLESIPASFLSDDDTVNLLSNPTLVSDDSDWTFDAAGMAFEPTWNDAFGYNSNGSIAFSGSGSSWALSEQIQATPGQQVLGSAYFQYAALGTGGSITLQVSEYDVNNNLLDTAGATTVEVSGSNNNWQQIQLPSTYTPSADADYVALMPMVDLPNGGSAWFSDFSLMKSGGVPDALVPGIQNIIDTISSIFGGTGTPFYTELTTVLEPVATAVGDFWQLVNAFSGGLVNDVGGLLNFTTLFNGIDWTEDPFNATAAWNTLVENFITQVDAFGTSINTTLENTFSDILDFLNIEPSSGNSVNEFSQWLSDLFDTSTNALTPNTPLNASNLWGLLPSFVAGQISSTSVTGESLNPLWNPYFTDSISISIGSGITWDSTCYYDVAVSGTPGSALINADGTPHAMRSNLIKVQNAQSLAIAVEVLTTNLVFTGEPIELDVVEFLGVSQVNVVQLETIGAPTGATTSWVNVPTGSYAGTMTEVYEAPNDGSVDGVQIRLVLNPGATGGQVRFGGVVVNQTGGLIADLQSIAEAFTQGQTAYDNWIASLLTNTNTFLENFNWTEFADSLNTNFNTYITTVTTLETGQFATLTQMLESMLGISPTTGLMAATNVSNVLGTGNLGTDVQAILDYIANALGHSGTGHTLTQVESYLGLIPSANVASVLGNTNLGQDVSAVNTTASNSNTWFQQILTELGITGSTNNGTNIASAISTAQNAATSAGSAATTAGNTANANTTTITSLLTSLFGGTTINNLTVIENDIINVISNAISGGNAPVSENSPAQTLLSALGIGGIPHNNVAIPPSPGTGTITHDVNATAAPYNTQTSLVTVPLSIEPTAAANFLTVRLLICVGQTASINITANGNQMQLLESGGTGDGYTFGYVYGIPIATSGSTEYTVDATVWTPYGSYIGAIIMEADSYIGVGSVGNTYAMANNAGSPVMSVPSAANDYVIQMFAYASERPSITLSSYTRTLQYNSAAIDPPEGTANSLVLMAGDYNNSAGLTSVSFGATTTNSTEETYAGLAVNLIPLSSSAMGSGFRAAYESTSNITGDTGNNLFPASFFAQQVITPDGSYSPTNYNAWTCGHAGWYNITIAVLLYDLYYNQFLGLNLVYTPNGGSSVTKRGNTPWIGGSGSSTVVSHTFQQYCNVGDTIQPGFYLSLSGTCITGTTDGLSTYFEISLGNRGVLS